MSAMCMKPTINSNMDFHHPHSILTPGYRIFLMNKRLQERLKNRDNQWWDMFVTEFFEDNATYTLSLCLEDGPKSFTIGRVLIPRFYKTIFESGVVEMKVQLHFGQNYHELVLENGTTLSCGFASMETQYEQPFFTKISIEGHLTVEFSTNEMRIQSWHFAIKNHMEYVPRQAPLHHPDRIEEMCANITRVGLPADLMNYLKMCVIIEPMKDLMSKERATKMSPRDCLKSCLFTKWSNQVVNPFADIARSTKKPSRKHKTSNANMNKGMQKKKLVVASEVMQVEEPTLMGSHFGADDERVIHRIENKYVCNHLHIKSEAKDETASFPNMSSSNDQWPNQIILPISQTNSEFSCKSEPVAVVTTPLSTCG